MADTFENPPVTTEERLAVRRGVGTSLLERWVDADPKAAMERADTMTKVLEHFRQASIRATYPSDWIIHVSRDQEGTIVSQKGYLQDHGAERAGKVWGIEVGSPATEEKQYSDDTFVVLMLSDAWSKVTGERLEYCEGSRWSGDPFFKKSIGPEAKIDPTDVRKSAYANLHGRAVRALAGLGGVPPEVLRAAGLDITKVLVVDYQKGAKGGESTGASVGTPDITIAWGKAKGKKIGELTNDDLKFYRGAYERDVADPAKAQYAKSNQRTLAALTAEQERRVRAAEQEQANDSTTGRPGKLNDLNTRLGDAAKAAGIRTGPLFAALTKEHFGADIERLSAVTDEQLERLNAIPEGELAAKAQELAKGGAK
jgi:hypothetical protein